MTPSSDITDAIVEAEKTELRPKMRELRRRLSFENPEAPRELLQWAQPFQLLAPAWIGAYEPRGSEIDPGPFLRSFAAHNSTGHVTPIAFPLPHAPGVPLSFSIPPPPEGLLLLIVPLLAFDRKGNRLGQGGGHYDRTIKTLRGAGFKLHPVGFAFAGQEVPSLPTGAHDERLDAIVTEREFIMFDMG